MWQENNKLETRQTSLFVTAANWKPEKLRKFDMDTKDREVESLEREEGPRLHGSTGVCDVTVMPSKPTGKFMDSSGS